MLEGGYRGSIGTPNAAYAAQPSVFRRFCSLPPKIRRALRSVAGAGASEIPGSGPTFRDLWSENLSLGTRSQIPALIRADVAAPTPTLSAIPVRLDNPSGTLWGPEPLEDRIQTGETRRAAGIGVGAPRQCRSDCTTPSQATTGPSCLRGPSRGEHPTVSIHMNYCCATQRGLTQ